ncbi:flagellar basal-body MS-ring/collar protein FliF [Thalassobacillus devorans]|uniref:flagellar basal-body MS-ring/collar protein FliF n=1 Tax=Thalassobacillus devorans TaxID=279813 RepID=UPI00048C358C|nr:flagellar basal-body MS-ring/collar protein FliF [Thalassobacillus devorans]
MRKNLIIFKENIANFWKERTKAQKSTLIGSVLTLIIVLLAVSFLSSKSNMVPLYQNLSLQEIGQMKTELDARNVNYELTQGGQTILVPESQVDGLLVDLAASGLPKSGNIDYSFFSENTSWGMTDNEFDMIKLDTMQTELANLIKGIEGIKDAQVMINQPPELVFVGDEQQEATASIVLHTSPGYQFKDNQLEGLYNLVSKSVPNLTTDNIVIMNQYFEYFDQNSSDSPGSGSTYTQQQNIKTDIERDIQRRVQQMLGTMVGMNKVVASVTTDIDFTQENRIEELVEPVDPDSMEGLPVSVERLTETYTGNPPDEGGVAGTGENDVPGYNAENENGGGDYEMVKETINNEFDRIQREIVESPYKIRDIGIQVAIDTSKGLDDTGEVQLLSQQEQATVEASVSSILDSIISTSIAAPYEGDAAGEHVSIVFQEFNGTAEQQPSPTGIPLWAYIAGVVLVAVVLTLLLVLLKKGRKQDEDEKSYQEFMQETVAYDIPELDEEKDTEGTVKRKQLERMAREKPEDFAKLLRSWIAED